MYVVFFGFHWRVLILEVVVGIARGSFVATLLIQLQVPSV
jgi:hypothetical protein